MADSSGPGLVCEACGRSYAWRADLAGKQVRCVCGQVMVMPAAASGGSEAAGGSPGESAGSHRSAASRRASAAVSPPPLPGQGMQADGTLPVTGGQTSGLAIAALTCGLVGALIPFCFPLWIVALICGFMALAAIARSEEQLRGRGMAVAGVILGFAAPAILALLVLTVALPGLAGLSRDRHIPMKNSSQLRGIHQSAVIHSQDNNFFLMGLDSSGEYLVDSPTTTGLSGPGNTVAARFWVLLSGAWIPAEMLENSQETLSAKWTSGAVTPAMYSYAMLDIYVPPGSTPNGRLSEWKDNANSSAILLSDRNVGADGRDANVRSLWTRSAGDWKGNQVWGDNHAEFITSHKGNKTRYLGAQQNDDNIFRDDEPGSTPGSNALMIHDK